MMGKSKPNRSPKLAGLDELDIVTSETDVPVPYFAGFRRLDVSWIMPAVINRTTSANGGGKGKGGKSGSSSKNYFGHCAGIVCQGQIDFITGLLINNELVYPNAAIWDSQIYKNKRTIIYTDGNAYQITADTDQPPPGFPWTIIAFAYAAGSYASGAKVVSGGMLFESRHNANVAAPPGTPTTNADWKYLSTPDQWATISTHHFWLAGAIVAWEGQVYQTNADTNAEPPNAPWTPFQILESASPNPLKMTVVKSTRFGLNAGPGDWYLYWGLPAQLLDAVNEQVLNGLGHPPYRNCPVIVGKNVAFGMSTVTPPSVQILAGRAPVQTLIVGAATQLDANWQCNPWVILAEMLTHPIYGLGLPATWFDAASWQAEADRCAANPSMFYISPLYTSLKRVSELVADLMSYPDAFILWSTIATLMAGHWPHGEAAPAFTAANTINRDNVTKEFESSSEGWWGTANSVAVSIQDQQAAFKARPCLASNLFNMTVTKRVLSQKIERPWITRYSQGLAWATEFAKIAGDQMSSGTVELQSEKAASVKPGSIFLMTDDVLQTSEVMRCTRRVISAPPTGTAKITYETERGAAPQPYSPTQTNPAPANGPAPALIQDYQVVQLPTALAGVANAIALLAGRQNDVTSALDVWFQQADAAAFQLLGTQSGFAVAATMDYISAAYPQIGPIQVTANSVKGTVYNVAGNLWNAQILYTPPVGAQTLGILGTDWTFDGNAGTVTIPLGSNIPNGSDVELFTSGVAFSNITQGDTYQLPDVDVQRVNVYNAASNTSQAKTLMAETTDYSIDSHTGQITVAVGGGIANGTAIIVVYDTGLKVLFATNTPEADIDAISAAPTLDEINDNDYLVFAFQAADPSKFEIMSLSGVQAVTPTGVVGGALPSTADHFLSVVRAQYGTLLGGDGSHLWDTGDLVFIIPRAMLTVLTHEAFEALMENGSTAKFILAPESAWVAADIGDLYDSANNPTGLSLEFSYTFDSLFAPTVTWIQEQQNGANIASFAGAFLTTDVFYFSFQLNAAPGAKVVSAALTGAIGEQLETLWAKTFSPAQQINAAAQFSLTSPGLWNITLTVRCDDGSAVDYPLTLVGSATAVQITVNTPAATFAPTPIILRYAKPDLSIVLLQFGVMATGLTVKYQVQPRGTAYNPASWIVLPESPAGSGKYGFVPNFRSGAKTLYAFSQKAGSTDSAVVSWNL